MADCDDAAAVGPYLGDADVVVHAAGITVWRGLAGAPSLDRPRSFVVVSSAGVYSRHRRSAAAYRRGEDALRARRPDAVIVRPTMIYGSIRDRNVHRVIAFARRYRALPVPLGRDPLVQPIHFADLAAGIAALAERDAEGVLDAGGPAPISLRRAGETIFRALGLRPVFVPVPLAAALPLARVMDLFARSRWTERVLRLQEDRTVDGTRFQDLAGVVPRDFARGVRDEVAEMLRR